MLIKNKKRERERGWYIYIYIYYKWCKNSYLDDERQPVKMTNLTKRKTWPGS